jgi:DNA-binding CsgD family transcriptional regulator
MKYRRRIYYSAEQRAEIWDRWQRGESMSSIGRRFDRQSSSVFSVISPTGGIRPEDRKRGKQALSLSEREEISRGLSVKHSLRAIARQLGRSPSTISREVRRNGALSDIARLHPIRQHGTEPYVPNNASWLVTRP